MNYSRALIYLFIVIYVSGCTSIPVIDQNWIESNCSSLAYFTPDTNEKKGCFREDIQEGIYNCNASSGDKYIGQFKNNDKHGFCKYIWHEDGSSFEGVCKDNDFWCGIEKRGSTFFTYINGDYTQSEAGVDWDTVGAAVLIAGAIYVAAELAEDSGGYSGGDYRYSCTYEVNGVEITRDAQFGSCPDIYYQEPLMCHNDNVYDFTRYCDEKACGDSCISTWKTCHIGRGTACNKNYRSYP